VSFDIQMTDMSSIQITVATYIEMTGARCIQMHEVHTNAQGAYKCYGSRAT